MRTLGFLIAFLIILLLLFIRVGVRIRSLGDTSLAMDFGLFSIPLFPKKEKDIRLSDYKIDKFRKNREKSAEKERKKRKKRLSKKSKTAAEKTTEKVEAARRKNRGLRAKKKDALETAHLICDLTKTFLSRFGKHLRIKVRRVAISVGSADAATTAVIYGGVCGAVQCFTELLDSCTDVKFANNAEIKVTPDFTSEKSDAQIDITFSFRLWQVFDILIRTGIAYLKKLL